MTRRPAAITQADVARAIRAAKQSRGGTGLFGELSHDRPQSIAPTTAANASLCVARGRRRRALHFARDVGSHGCGGRASKSRQAIPRDDAALGVGGRSMHT